jgi:hypothetical protein
MTVSQFQGLGDENVKNWVMAYLVVLSPPKCGLQIHSKIRPIYSLFRKIACRKSGFIPVLTGFSQFQHRLSHDVENSNQNKKTVRNGKTKARFYILESNPRRKNYFANHYTMGNCTHLDS